MIALHDGQDVGLCPFIRREEGLTVKGETRSILAIVGLALDFWIMYLGLLVRYLL